MQAVLQGWSAAVVARQEAEAHADALVSRRQDRLQSGVLRALAEAVQESKAGALQAQLMWARVQERQLLSTVRAWWLQVLAKRDARAVAQAKATEFDRRRLHSAFEGFALLHERGIALQV